MIGRPRGDSRGRRCAGASLLLLALLTLRPATAADRPLAAVLEQIRTEHAVPALAAASIRSVKMLESGAVGVRRLGSAEKVTVEDRWHLGSCTKSMTATLAAMLVEQGVLQWSSTVGAAFPDLRDTMDSGWQGVSLEQLLTHRSGAPAEAPANLWRIALRQSGTPTQQRMEFVRGLLMRRPGAPPGSTFTYSNQGYSIAGAMLEQAAGESWEKLMQTRLFAACVMPQAGFGAPASIGKADQPWGHRLDGGTLVPVPPGPAADNPPAIGPAGTVHATIEEFARYAAWHVRGERTGLPSLKRESFTRLHAAASENGYAMGWVVAPRSWAGGNALTHSGSNTMFFAVMWLAPARDLALVAATNCAGDAAAKACDAAVSALLERATSGR